MRKQWGREEDTRSTRKLSDHVLPQNLEAEMAVLGSVLLDPDCMSLVAQRLQSEDFHSTPHQVIFSVLLDLFEKNAPMDVVVVKDELAQRERLEEIGGAGDPTPVGGLGAIVGERRALCSHRPRSIAPAPAHQDVE